MREDRKLGDKLGPRLVSLMVQGTIAARRGIAPVEARAHQAATQAIIDRMGMEVADLYRPLLDEVLATKADTMHPLLQDHLRRVSSGTHQWESLLGHLQIGAAGVLGQTLSNAIAPVAYTINHADRSLYPDPASFASAAAAGLITKAEADRGIGSQGYTPGSTEMWFDLAQNIPDISVLYDLVLRGLIPEERAAYWLQRSAVPDELQSGIMALRKVLLTPPDLALAVLRGNMTEDEGRRVAAQSGVDPGDFDVLLNNTGEPLGLMQLLEAYRRKFIDRSRLAEGIRESRVRDEWIPVAEALRYSPMATADAIDALLKGHITEDRARDLADQNGLEPGDFDALYAAAGEPLALEQLLEARRRGFISADRLAEGIRQGRLRDDWIPTAERLAYAPMSTADAVEAALRGHISVDRARDLATQNGLEAGDFDALYQSAGDPLSLTQLWDAWRRGYIDQSRFEQGLRQGRLRDDWIPTAIQLRYEPMSAADAIEAAVQNHITVKQAEEIAAQNGLAPADFNALYQTAGSPLSRIEAEDLWNRGLMTEAEVKQALRESRLKDKYVDLALQLRVRLPEPRLVVDMITHGVITRSRGMDLLRQAGYPADTAANLIAYGEITSTGRYKELALSQILKLYEDRIITAPAATTMITTLHYTEESAGFLLQLADLGFQQRITNQAITVVRGAYMSHRLTDEETIFELDALDVPDEAKRQYLRFWAVERKAKTKTLTEAQIVKAYKQNMFDAQDADSNRVIACTRLGQLGYDDTDAGLLLDGA